MDKKNKIMLVLGFGFFLVFSMFLFGDLGIVQTHRKGKKLDKLKKEIASMKLLDIQKKKLIEQLRNDPATIKKQATLYGLVGGVTVSEKVRVKQVKVIADNSTLSTSSTSNVLLEHPALLILLVLIVLLITSFVLKFKSKQIIKRPQKKAYIKPSWN